MELSTIVLVCLILIITAGLTLFVWRIVTSRKQVNKYERSIQILNQFEIDYAKYVKQNDIPLDVAIDLINAARHHHNLQLTGDETLVEKYHLPYMSGEQLKSTT